jgi:hypothetical protein
MSLTDKLFKAGGKLFECGRTAALEAAKRGYSKVKEIKENGVVNTVKSDVHHGLNRLKSGGKGAKELLKMLQQKLLMLLFLIINEIIANKKNYVGR